MGLENIKIKTNKGKKKPWEYETRLEKLDSILGEYHNDEIVLKQVINSDEDVELKCYALVAIMKNHGIEFNEDDIENLLISELDFDSKKAQAMTSLLLFYVRSSDLEDYINYGSSLSLRKTVSDENENLDKRCNALYELLQRGNKTYSPPDIVNYLRTNFRFNEFDAMMIMRSLDKYMEKENLPSGNIHF